MKAFDKLVQVVDGQPQLVGDPPLIVPIEDLLSDREYHRSTKQFTPCCAPIAARSAGDHRHLLEGFRYAHAARKVVGVGSVGTRAWILLMLGTTTATRCSCRRRRPKPSVLEPFLGKSRYANHGQRVVEGQRLMQSASDIMLGWIRTDGIDGVPATSTSANSGTARDRRSSRP